MNQIIIEYPLEWLEWYVGYPFPAYSEFKPVYPPKWWEGMTAWCRDEKCNHEFALRDIEVTDRFRRVDNNECHVWHSCPKCGTRSFTRKVLFYIIEDQVIAHLKKHNKIP